MKNTKQIILLLLISLAFAACRYDEGPMISFRTVENRIAKSFTLVEFTKNGVDITALFSDSVGYYWSFLSKEAQSSSAFEENLYVYSTAHGPGPASLWAKWSLNEKRNKMTIVSSPRYVGMEPFLKNDVCTWEIKRLTNTDFWLSCEYNNSTYYLKLLENEK